MKVYQVNNYFVFSTLEKAYEYMCESIGVKDKPLNCFNTQTTDRGFLYLYPNGLQIEEINVL